MDASEKRVSIFQSALKIESGEGDVYCVMQAMPIDMPIDGNEPITNALPAHKRGNYFHFYHSVVNLF